MIEEMDQIEFARDIVVKAEVKGYPPRITTLAKSWFLSEGGARYRVKNCLHLLPEYLQQHYASIAR